MPLSMKVSNQRPLTKDPASLSRRVIRTIAGERGGRPICQPPFHSDYSEPVMIGQKNGIKMGYHLRWTASVV